MAELIKHEVKSGETLVSIAHHYGYDAWEWAWNHELNRELREHGRGPNVLGVGDLVHLPPIPETFHPAKTGKLNTFQLARTRTVVRVQVYDDWGPSLDGLPYEVLVAGEPHAAGDVGRGGLIEVEVGPKVRELELRVHAPNRTLCWSLGVGKLAPFDTVAGQQARLRNLGLYEGDVTGEADEAFARAVRRFQRRFPDLEVTGTCDAKTAARLKREAKVPVAG